jgi:hypothetical protein
MVVSGDSSLHRLTSVVYSTPRPLAPLPVQRAMDRLYLMFNSQSDDGSHCGPMGARAAHSIITLDNDTHAGQQARELETRALASGQRGGVNEVSPTARQVSPLSPSSSTNSPSSSSPPSSSSADVSASDSASDLSPRDAQPLTGPKTLSHSFLTGADGEHFRPLGKIWQKAANYRVKPLGTGGKQVTLRLDRLHVHGDGSCPRGSLALALASPPYNRCAAHNARDMTVIAAIGNDIADYVEKWTVQQWEASLNQEQHVDIWDCRPKCTCGPGTTVDSCTCHYHVPREPAAERQLFLAQCRHTTYPMPPTFFSLASMALRVGVLLLVDTPSHDKQEAVRQVYDFGTEI